MMIVFAAAGNGNVIQLSRESLNECCANVGDVDPTFTQSFLSIGLPVSHYDCVSIIFHSLSDYIGY